MKQECEQQNLHSEQELEELLDNTQTGVLYLDDSLCIRMIAGFICRYTDCKRTDIGKDIREFHFLSGYPDWKTDMERCLENGQKVERDVIQGDKVFLCRMSPCSREGSERGIVVSLTDITQRYQKEEELKNRSIMDSMTGLLNHQAVQKQIENRLKERRGEKDAYLVICDVDDFKQINDTYGHLYGDAVLCNFAEKLNSQFPKAIKGRIGGDEFLLLVEDMDQERLENCLREINGFMQGESADKTISSSIGVAVVEKDQTDYNVLFQWADCALYRVKADQKNGYEILRVPADRSIPETSDLTKIKQRQEFKDPGQLIIRTEDELLLFCMELLENVPDIMAALRMVSERTCKFYHLDEMSCIDYNEKKGQLFCSWKDSGQTEADPVQAQLLKLTWQDNLALMDRKDFVVSKDLEKFQPAEKGKVLIISSVAVRDCLESVVYIDRKQERDWESVRSVLGRIANQIFYRLRTLRKELDKQRLMDLKLNYDELTGLPVYNQFINSTKRYIENYGIRKLYCIYTDFSGFQYFNEIYGYEAGDAILRRYAEKLLEKYGHCGIFARVSSDNFVGIVQGPELEEIQKSFMDFSEQFTEKCNLEYPLTNLVLAVGMYEAKRTDYSVATMVDNANEARKKCKEQRVETMVKVYTDSLRQELEQTKAINSNILTGLKNQEFFAYLQPKVSLKTGRIVGAEALVRWIRPDGTRVMPDEFISIAEKNGYITKIDFAVLKQVVLYLEDALQKGEEVVPISVNFSRRNNEFEDFVPNILNELKRHHIPPRLLEAEVTESIFMADLSIVDQNLSKLRGNGVEVSVDDFGSGYSSLNMLARISADTVKLDRLFLYNAGKEDRGLTVIQYLTKMLKNLGFTVLAEGVETKEQLEWLKKADCDLVQGFYYAKPMQIEEFRIFLKEFNTGQKNAEDV